jgi:hypothetical protein
MLVEVDNLIMESIQSHWTDLLERVTERVLFLESFADQISYELRIQRAIREEWFSWNEKWKSAWLLSDNEEMRIATSVQSRLQP